MKLDDKTKQIFTDGIKQAVKMRDKHNGSDDFMLGVFVQYCDDKFNNTTIKKIQRKAGRPKGTKKGQSSVTKLNRDRHFLEYALLCIKDSKITKTRAAYKIGKKHPELAKSREHLSEVIHDENVNNRSFDVLMEAIQEKGGVNSKEDLIKAIEQALKTLKNYGEKYFY